MSIPAASGCTTSSPGLSVQILRCCSRLCFRLGFASVFASCFLANGVVSRFSEWVDAARSRIQNQSLQRGRTALFQDRLPPYKRSPETGAKLFIGHGSTIELSALAAAPPTFSLPRLSLPSDTRQLLLSPTFLTLTTHPASSTVHLITWMDLEKSMLVVGCGVRDRSG